MNNPKGSFRTHGGKWWIACWECNRGINGDKSCSKGQFAKNLKTGCYNGKLLAKYNMNESEKGE